MKSFYRFGVKISISPYSDHLCPPLSKIVPLGVMKTVFINQQLRKSIFFLNSIYRSNILHLLRGEVTISCNSCGKMRADLRARKPWVRKYFGHFVTKRPMF